MTDQHPTPCTRTIDTAANSLRCSVHPDAAFPWAPQPGCDLPVASVCAVCARVEVPIEGRFSWSFLCLTCAGLDQALARDHDAAFLTPFRGQIGCEAGTVYAALFPERAAQVTVSVDPGPPPRVRTDKTPGTDPWLARLAKHRKATVQTMARQAQLVGVVGWASWEATFAPSAQATARAYQAYIAAVHPWADTVEPRTSDLAWLTALVPDPVR